MDRLPLGWILLPLVVAAALVPSLAQAQGEPQAPRVPRYERAAIIPVEGMITSMTVAMLERHLQAARSKECDLIVLEITSPGGELQASLELADMVGDIADAHVVAYIPDEAISGAAMLSFSTDEILMQPGALIGDIGVITMGEDGAFRFAEEKLVSYVVARLREIAIKAGHSPTLAEAMVEKDFEVFVVKNRETGEIQYMSQAEIDGLGGERRWEVLNPLAENNPRRFLTLSGERAEELGLAAATVQNREQVLQRYGVVRPPVIIEFTWIDVTAMVLNSWLVTGLLLILGIVFLYVELQAPGIGVGAALSAVCFGLFFWSKFLGGTSGWLEVVLFAAGVLCILMELFVIPGFGISGLLGIGLVFASLVMASSSGVFTETGIQTQELMKSVTILAVSMIVSVGVVWGLSRYLGSIPMFRGISIAPPESEVVSQEDVTAQLMTLLGQTGFATSPLRPAGKATINDQFLDVYADAGFIPAGTPVEVVDIRGMRVIVREVRDANVV